MIKMIKWIWEVNFAKLLKTVNSRVLEDLPDDVPLLWVGGGWEYLNDQCQVFHIANVIVNEKLKVSDVDQCKISTI